MSNDARFRAAIAAFDRENAKDPNLIPTGDALRPRELVQAERLSVWIERLEPSASEALCLAARCQHLRRWEIARSEFSEGRVGYLQWRTTLGRFHADEAAKILSSVGYEQELIDKVRRINAKQGLRSDPDVQTMEDALCLSFLEHDLEEFATRHDHGKVVGILQKTWKKMSERGQRAAEELLSRLPDQARQLVTSVLSGSSASRQIE